jgi:Holliday junction resolvasome RuvABC endonuclease subunit|tara:strand:+ start:1612 stop:2295 length:684 start_codon:yes stop_codon:yes gene_type:complete
MLVLGIDPATITGWALVEDSKKLVEYGYVTAPKDLKLISKLDYYHIEISKLVKRLQPDYVAIEDTILARSGVNILKYLSRINGSILHSVYKSGIPEDHIKLYDTRYWKANSIPGLKGNARKWDIQLSVCNYFKINIDKKYFSIVSSCEKSEEDKKEEIKELRRQLKKNKKLKKQINIEKENLKKLKKENNKKLMKLTVTIYQDTGISTDIADSIGMAICFFKENKIC